MGCAVREQIWLFSYNRISQNVLFCLVHNTLPSLVITVVGITKWNRIAVSVRDQWWLMLEFGTHNLTGFEFYTENMFCSSLKTETDQSLPDFAIAEINTNSRKHRNFQRGLEFLKITADEPCDVGQSARRSWVQLKGFIYQQTPLWQSVQNNFVQLRFCQFEYFSKRD